MGNWLSTISACTALLLVLAGCNNSEVKNTEGENSDGEFSTLVSKQEIQGYIQGTTFTIKTSDDSLFLSTNEIESVLSGFDAELSSYMSGSLISRVNDSSANFSLPKNSYFNRCFKKSIEIYKLTDGAFDPSVFPLVKAWGFFKDSTLLLTQKEVDSCLQFISFEPGKLYRLTANSFYKKDDRFKFDFNAIAQGLSVDIVAELLNSKGQENYYVEIGGEMITRGVNFIGKPWVIGVDVPQETNDGLGKRKLENLLDLQDKALATSGNYRKFYEVDGRKYSHTIDPKTGYSVKHSLLSATVMADDAATADAFATAFMVLGKEKSMDFVKSHPELNLEVYLLFQNEEGRIERAYTQGMSKLIHQ